MTRGLWSSTYGLGEGGGLGGTNSFPKMAVRCDAVQDYHDWVAFTGVRPDYVHAFGWAGNTWADSLTWAQTQSNTFAGYNLVWGMPLAQNQAGQKLTNTAAGTFDTEINQMLDIMLAHNPTGPIYLRPGWEAGNFAADWPWMANTGDRVKYIEAFQRVHGMAKAKSARFVIGWSVAAVNYIGSTITNPTDATTGWYPGDAYVDYIGVDNYLVGSDISDGYDFTTLGQDGNRLLVDNHTWSLHFLADFARSRGKSMAIDEWGVGADRPDYIRDHAKWMNDPRNRVLYHGYWNKNAEGQGAGGTAPFKFPCRLSANTNIPASVNNYPLSKAAFLSAFYGSGVPYTEHPMTTAYIARSTATVTDARRAAIDALIRTIASNGLDAYLDGLWILAGQDNNITMLNIYGAGGFTTTTQRTTGRGLIMSGTTGPTFVADRGFTGTGLVTDYIATGGTNLSNALNRKIAQNDAHLGIYSRTNSNPVVQSYEAGTPSTFIGRNSSGVWVGRPNSVSTVPLTGLSADAGHIMWNKTSSTNWQSFLNGVAAKSQADTAIVTTPITSDSLRICGTMVSGGINQLSFVHFGSALPTVGVNGPAVLNAAMLTYLQAVGAVA